VEAECPFIKFDDLLDRLEDLICDVVDRVLKSPYADIVHELNPNFQVPSRPFLRMNYSDAIEYLKKNNITKEDGSFYEFGEVCMPVLFSFLTKCRCRTFPKCPREK
jgi:asparaginyl-tRNA synthetase